MPHPESSGTDTRGHVLGPGVPSLYDPVHRRGLAWRVRRAPSVTVSFDADAGAEADWIIVRGGVTRSAEPWAGASLDTTGSWARLDDMSAPRASFTALELLDGRVFVIDQDSCNSVMSDLGGPPHPPLQTDLLDPASGRWTATAALNAPRSGFVVVRLHDGRILVTGGNNGWHGSYSSTKLFDPATGQWTAAGLLNTARKNPVGALLQDGRVLVAGGTYSDGFRDEADFFSRPLADRELTSAEIYDPATDRWTPTGSLTDAAAAGTAYSLPDGRVLAVGHDWVAEPVAEVYDPRRGTWAAAGRLVRPQGSTSVVLMDGSLLVVGGTGEVVTHGSDGDSHAYDPVATVRRFDPDTGVTVEVSPLPAPRTGAIAVRLSDGRVLVAGGTEHGQLAVVCGIPSHGDVLHLRPSS